MGRVRELAVVCFWRADDQRGQYSFEPTDSGFIFYFQPLKLESPR